MESFEELNISKQLLNAITDMGFEKPTPIQEEAFPIAMSGKNIVGIAQTGTGKTLAYMLPILQQFKFSKRLQAKSDYSSPYQRTVNTGSRANRIIYEVHDNPRIGCVWWGKY